ncbi:hypothetical protein B2G71_22220 [Novosphingobium sp. PC22D]|nr:hypothetical protein B2G71_22220 [Novosphingobium sp. PC22D]
MNWPSSNWNGTAGSGFAAAPADPPRTAAKPAMRLLVPPNQYYNNEIVVGVVAAANFNGSLRDNLGTEKVVAHFEGSSVSITSASFRAIVDSNGKLVAYFGWWVCLVNRGLHGHANLYSEAIPKDASMQSRVIGPYQFSPAAVLHDYDLTIEPSQAQVVGSRYQTLPPAIAYLKSVNAQNPRIMIKEAGNYDVTFTAPTYTGNGWLTIEADVPVNLKRATLDPVDNNNVFRCRYNGIRFKGENITFDMVSHSAIWTETATPQRYHWLDGCRVTNSAIDGDENKSSIGARDRGPWAYWST